jgi:hypothetical protein
VTTQKVWFADVPPVGAEPLGEVRVAARYRVAARNSTPACWPASRSAHRISV